MAALDDAVALLPLALVLLLDQVALGDGLCERFGGSLEEEEHQHQG